MEQIVFMFNEPIPYMWMGYLENGGLLIDEDCTIEILLGKKIDENLSMCCKVNFTISGDHMEQYYISGLRCGKQSKQIVVKDSYLNIW